MKKTLHSLNYRCFFTWFQNSVLANTKYLVHFLFDGLKLELPWYGEIRLLLLDFATFTLRKCLNPTRNYLISMRLVDALIILIICSGIVLDHFAEVQKLWIKDYILFLIFHLLSAAQLAELFGILIFWLFYNFKLMLSSCCAWSISDGVDLNNTISVIFLKILNFRGIYIS